MQFIVKKISFFVLIVAVTWLLAGSTPAQKHYAIAEIQGDKSISAHERENVSVTGVVTARTATGFFLQSPDDKQDGNPATSEGIFVFTRSAPPADVAVGSIVTVAGEVQEYRNRQDTNSLTITELAHRLGQDSLQVISKGNSLPKAVVFTAADIAPDQIDEFERFEGMRVTIPEMLVAGPTGGRVDIKAASAESNGVFFAVPAGAQRPFREPGMDIRDVYASPERDKWKTAVPKMRLFDGNPEVLRVDTKEQQSSVVLNVAARTTVRNITGVMHYAFGRYTVLTDPTSNISATSTIKPVALQAPAEGQFSIAGMNLENFFDDRDDAEIREDVLTPEAFARRLKKVSMAIREYLQTPDVIGVVEVESLAALKRLADKINSDAVAAGKPDPKYAAYLEEGNDGRGIDNGFLVKTSRVKVIEVKQFGKSEKYKNPDTGEDNFLNDRPPLMLRASIDDAKTGKPVLFTVVVNHLKSLLGYNDPKQMANVRLKKKLQAEFLARFVQERLKSDANEMIALIGDFNAYQFDDGVMDVIGTIKGKPAAKDQVLISSDDLLSPDLTDLVDVIKPAEKYSYVYDGSAQVLDHFLISPAFVNHVKGFGYARVNADYPESLRSDDTRVERYSDHDPAIAYFSLEAAPQR
jgi:predicted extracellular nuclease